MTCSHQGGWVGLVVILVALVIVAFLAKDALKKYDQSAPQAPGAALDRARGVEEMVQRQADERAQRMDGVK